MLLGGVRTRTCDELCTLGGGDIAIDIGLDRNHAQARQLTRGARLGDFASIAVERQRESHIEWKFSDAVIPVIARFQYELRILTRDRLFELGFRLRILTDCYRKISARQKRLLAGLALLAFVHRRRRAPIRPDERDPVQCLRRQAQGFGGGDLGRCGNLAQFGRSLLDFDARLLTANQFDRSILSCLYPPLFEYEQSILGRRKPIQ